MKMTSTRVFMTVCAALFMAAVFFASCMAESMNVQIYSPWNEYYGRIFKGSDNGLKTGQKLEVFRDGVKIGELVLSDVTPGISRGKFIPSDSGFILGEAEASSSKTSGKEVVVLSGEPVTLGENSQGDGSEYYTFNTADIKQEDSSMIPSSGDGISKTVSPCAAARKAEAEAKSETGAGLSEISIEKIGGDSVETPAFGSPAYHMKLANMYMAIDRYELALDHYSIAMKMTPSRDDLKENMKVAAERLGIIGMGTESTGEEEAAEEEQAPEEAPVVEEEKPGEAEPAKDMQATAEVSTDVILNNFGVFLIGKGMYREALAKLNEAIKINPDDPVYYRNRALAYYYMEDYASAVENAEIAIDRGDTVAEQLMADLKTVIPGPQTDAEAASN